MHNPFIVLSILRPILKTSQTGYVVIRHPMVTENFFPLAALLFYLHCLLCFKMLALCQYGCVEFLL